MMFRGLEAALSAPATVPVYSATGTALLDTVRWYDVQRAGGGPQRTSHGACVQCNRHCIIGYSEMV